jgi:TonB family protein
MKGELGWAALVALSSISCSPSSAIHPRSAADVAAAQRDWSSRVRLQIRDYWNPWAVSSTLRSTEWSRGRPTAILRVAVKSDGTAARPDLLTSSGIPALDDTAVRAVAAALPLPSPPPELLNGAGLAAVEVGFQVVHGEDASGTPVDDQPDPSTTITAACGYSTSGAIDPLDVQRTVESYRREVVDCLERHHNEAESPIGEVTIAFVIAESGSVRHPVVLNARGLTRPLEGCVLRAMSAWTFPKPKGGAVKVVFPFRFWGGQAGGQDFRGAL